MHLVRRPAVYLVFDTETTGLPTFERGRRGFPPPSSFARYDSSRVVSIAWMLVRADDHVVIWQDAGLIRPEGFSIPREATAVHGITTAKAAAEGEAFDDVLSRFERCLCEEVVGHNVDFDVNVLGAELYRRGARWGACLGSLMKARRTCTMAMAKRVLALSANPKLSALYEMLMGESPPGALHDAQVDTLACYRCLVKMKTKLAGIPAGGFVPGDWILVVHRSMEVPPGHEQHAAALRVLAVPAEFEHLLPSEGMLHRTRIAFDTLQQAHAIRDAAVRWARDTYSGAHISDSPLCQG